MLHLDEFATSLLTGFDDGALPCRALFGGDGPLLEGASHGHGVVYFHNSASVRSVARELGAMPESHLRERFVGMAQKFRLAASGAYGGDEEVQVLQRSHFRRLQEFYREGAEQGDFILPTLV